MANANANAIAIAIDIGCCLAFNDVDDEEDRKCLFFGLSAPSQTQTTPQTINNTNNNTNKNTNSNHMNVTAKVATRSLQKLFKKCLIIA